MDANAGQSTDGDGAPEPAPAESAALPVGLLCPQCGYDLRGLTSRRCPECGFSLDSVRAQESQIPWVHRKQLGRFRAYWKTVWFVLRRPKESCLELEIVRPVSYADARRFRWVTVLHAWVPLLAACGAWYFAGPGTEAGDLQFRLILAGCFVVGSLLALAALTGLPSYFFHPRHLPIAWQNRAIALSYYAAAPLAASVVSLVFYSCAVPAWVGFDETPEPVFVAAGAVYLGTVVSWWMCLLYLANRVLPRSGPAALLRMMAAGVLWIIIGALILLGVHFVTLYVILFAYSLT